MVFCFFIVAPLSSDLQSEINHFQTLSFDTSLLTWYKPPACFWRKSRLTPNTSSESGGCTEWEFQHLESSLSMIADGSRPTEQVQSPSRFSHGNIRMHLLKSLIFLFSPPSFISSNLKCFRTTLLVLLILMNRWGISVKGKDGGLLEGHVCRPLSSMWYLTYVAKTIVY